MRIITYNKKIDKFINDLERRCKTYDTTIYLSSTNYVKWGKNKSNGYFSIDPNVLYCAVGINQEKWLRTLIHESCHFDQWVQKCKAWNDYCNDEDNFDVQRAIELDCEKRTIKKAKKYNLPVNIRLYTKQASAYVFFYTFMKKYKKWYKIGHEPYNNKKILSIMPSNLNGSYEKLTPKMEKLFMECI